MKKILIVFTVVLALFTSNVKAADQYCATLYRTGAEKFNYNGRIHTLYFIAMNSSSGSSRGFCLDPGLSVEPNTKNAYVRSGPNEGVTQTMRQLYQFAIDSGGFTPEEKSKLNKVPGTLVSRTINVAAQAGFWSGGFSIGGAIQASVRDEIVSYYRNRNQEVDNDVSNILWSVLSSSLTRYSHSSGYQGTLYIYSRKKGGSYQRFITAEAGEPCEDPEKPNPTEPEEPTPNQPNEPCDGLFASKIVGYPAVCANPNTTNIGRFEEELDKSACGNSNEYGTFKKQVGEYCKLFCKESVEMRFPGGLSDPITVGTNFVWPTNGGTYTLSYEGKKDCTLVVSDVEEIQKDYAEAANFIKTNQKDFHDDAMNNSCTGYNQKLQTAINNLKQANENYKKAQSNTEKAQEEYNKAEADQKSAEKDYNSANINYQNALRTAQNLQANWESCKAEKSGICSNKDKSCWGNCGGDYNACLAQCQEVRNCVNTICGDSSRIEQDKANILGAAEEERRKAEQKLSGANQRLTQWANTLRTRQEQENAAKKTYNTAQNARNTALKNLATCQNYAKYYEYADHVIQELDTCANMKFSISDLYNFSSDTSISYDDNEFGATYKLVGNTEYECINCDNANSTYSFTKFVFDKDKVNNPNYLQQILDSIGSRLIAMTANVSYVLPDDDSTYKYISKRTSKPLKSPIGDVISVGYPFLPTSYNADTGKTYSLNVIINSLGEDGKFTAVANASKYTCPYSVIDIPTPPPTIEDSCKCPPESDRPNQSLDSVILYSSTGLSCTQAQYSSYCWIKPPDEKENVPCPNDESIDIKACLETNTLSNCIETWCPIPDRKQYCENKPSINLTPCLNKGFSYDFCYQKLCIDEPVEDDYHCPKGTYNDGMDIKPCVFANIDMGLQGAIQYCVDTVCPGNNIFIYRTISLRNPFPGKTAGFTRITNQFSLDNRYGRTPGSNWNSVGLVKKEILMNRGVEADAVYNKEPLYTFILDSATIKEWRRYNDAQEKNGGYADYTLDCDSSGYACISSVIRNAAYGLQVSQSACSSSSHSEFYVCSES